MGSEIYSLVCARTAATDSEAALLFPCKRTKINSTAGLVFQVRECKTTKYGSQPSSHLHLADTPTHARPFMPKPPTQAQLHTRTLSLRVCCSKRIDERNEVWMGVSSAVQSTCRIHEDDQSVLAVEITWFVSETKGNVARSKCVKTSVLLNKRLMEYLTGS